MKVSRERITEHRILFPWLWSRQNNYWPLSNTSSAINCPMYWAFPHRHITTPLIHIPA